MSVIWRTVTAVVALVAIGLAGFGLGRISSAYAQGGVRQAATMGPGMWMGPGMMGPGMMGPGMMGPGMMGPGMMGPGMMGPGTIGPGMMGWGWSPQQFNLNLSANDVKSSLERWIAMTGNPHIKVGNVTEKDANTITADIITTDKEALVQRFSVDRRTGFYAPAR